MLTVIPQNKANELLQSKCLRDFNNMPQLDPRIRKEIRSYMAENVGYENLPIACFGRSEHKKNLDAADIMHVLPMNAKTDIIFQLDMPSDMVVSIDFNELMEASNDVKNAIDEEDAAYILEEFRDKLQRGLSPSETSVIFIPFLDLDRCRFYAKASEDMGTNELDFPTVERMDIRKITSFL